MEGSDDKMISMKLHRDAPDERSDVLPFPGSWAHPGRHADAAEMALRALDAVQARFDELNELIDEDERDEVPFRFPGASIDDDPESAA